MTRLLKAIMATAVDDGLIRRNPCLVKGAGTEKSPDWPVLSVAQIYALADATGPRYRALILLACFCGLRWGELAALCRCDIDTKTGTVRVTRQLTEVLGQPPIFGPPKSDAGRRTVVVPEMILPDVSSHLASFTPSEADALALTSIAESRCGTVISAAGSGCLRSPLLACPASTSMTCAMPGTSLSPTPGRTSAS
jgi:integrase